MAAVDMYFTRIKEILSAIQETQKEKIEAAATAFSRSIQSGGKVYLFGSGHSVIHVLDIFPRYGSFVGFQPIFDPRLMWSNVIGPGGARELLWLEQQEGYASIILQSYDIQEKDCMVVFSHGGLNAVPIEMAMAAKKKGATVVTVSSHQNRKVRTAKHSSGKMLADVADIAIDNCVPPEDGLVPAEGTAAKLAAGSTAAGVCIAMSLVAETGTRLIESGAKFGIFVSPNVGLSPDNNDKVYADYTKFFRSRP